MGSSSLSVNSRQHVAHRLRERRQRLPDPPRRQLIGADRPNARRAILVTTTERCPTPAPSRSSTTQQGKSRCHPAGQKPWQSLGRNLPVVAEKNSGGFSPP